MKSDNSIILAFIILASLLSFTAGYYAASTGGELKELVYYDGWIDALDSVIAIRIEGKTILEAYEKYDKYGELYKRQLKKEAEEGKEASAIEF